MVMMIEEIKIILIIIIIMLSLTSLLHNVARSTGLADGVLLLTRTNLFRLRGQELNSMSATHDYLKENKS